VPVSYSLGSRFSSVAYFVPSGAVRFSVDVNGKIKNKETRETAHWWETAPVSLWWESRSETWSEKTYWKTAWSKIVIWSIQILWDATHWHSSTYQQMWKLTSTGMLAEIMTMFWSCFILSVYFYFLTIFCVIVSYRNTLSSSTVSLCVQILLKNLSIIRFMKRKLSYLLNIDVLRIGYFASSQ
jgi:hypothetical protein